MHIVIINMQLELYSTNRFRVRTYFYISKSSPFSEVASSVFRPLTKIPHCCTRLPWDFFVPNVVDQLFSFDYENLGLLRSNLNNNLSRRPPYVLLKRHNYPFFDYGGFFPLFKAGSGSILTCTPLLIK